MSTIQRLSHARLLAVAKVLGDTSGGLTGSEIGSVVQEMGLADVKTFPGHQGWYSLVSKKDRLFAVLRDAQSKRGSGAVVLDFVQRAMSPERHLDKRERFEALREKLNVALAFLGAQLGSDGKLRESAKATTIPEAESRARRLRGKLLERRAHETVLTFCSAELVAGNCFHAVLEAVKSIADRVRELSGLDLDGSALVDAAFSGATKRVPPLAFNTLRTETERSEQTGLASMMRGLFSAFRNPTAHEPKIKWQIREDDALDILSMVSLLHRRLDLVAHTGSSVPTGPTSSS